MSKSSSRKNKTTCDVTALYVYAVFASLTRQGTEPTAFHTLNKPISRKYNSCDITAYVYTRFDSLLFP